MEDSEFAQMRAYQERIAHLRRMRGLTQAEMARALGISLDRYKKYEIRSALPIYLIERFARVVGHDIGYIVTGKRPDRRRGPIIDGNNLD
jgi:transcriptional regulator with XRE-family HTH domain